jgi:Ca-activated chloride channel homolog
MAKYLLSATGTVVFCAALLAAPGVPGQLAAGPAQGSPVFSSRSDLVVLDVLVTTRNGTYVAGLGSDAFTIEEDGVRQTIQFFGEHDSPATVGLIVDSSGSMVSAGEGVIAAVAAFVETGNRDDEVFALAFNERVYSALPPDTPFTGDPRTLRDGLTGAFNPWGRTSLYDAMVGGFEYLARGSRQRKALVVVSDGGDNASRATLDDVVRISRASNTVIYAIGLSDPLEPEANPLILKRLAEASGGNAFRPKNTRQISRDLRVIAQDIRNSYTIGYVSTNLQRDGRLRRIRVTAERAGQRDLRVRTREGYVAK